MAEEITTDHVKSEKIEPEDVDKKANPNEGLTITKGPPKILSRYLSGPRSSCHDFCKYGIQHAIEAKPWSPTHKRVTTRERKTKVPGENVTFLAGTKKSGSSSNPSHLTSKIGDPDYPVDIKEVTNAKAFTSEKQSPPFEETDVSMEHNNSDMRQTSSEPPSLPVQECSKSQTKRELVKGKSPFGSSSRKETESRSKQKRTDEKTVTSDKNSPPFEETDVSMEHNNSDIRQASSEPSSLPVQECSKSQTKRELVKNKSPFGSSSRKETERRSKQKRTYLTGGKEKSTPPSILLSSKQNVKKPSSSNAKTAKNLTGVSLLKTLENVEEVKPELANNDKLQDKIVHVIEPTSARLSEEPTLASDATKLPSPSPSPSPSPPSSGDKSLKQASNKTGKSGVSASSRKGLRHAGHGTRSTVSVALSHLSSGNKGKINMQHRTGSVSRSPSVLSSVSSSNSSRGKQNGTTSKSNKTAHGYQGENVKVGYKIRPKMTTIVGATNKVIPPRKLTFRRGKVIEIQPQSNNIPRRLKFRPARLLGDDIRRDVNGTRTRTITNKQVDGGESNAANIKTEKVNPKHQTVEGGKSRSVGRKVVVDRSKLHGSKSGSEKVVLRHQDVEGKKQNPRLYNNVIEETASMLAEIRKSKVKALVGAFETVISLDSPREAAPAEVSTVC